MVSRNLPFEYFVLGNVQLDGAVVAHVGGRPIRDAVIDARGSRYRFVGFARRDGSGRLDVEALRPGEWIVEPNLVYAADEKPVASSLDARLEKNPIISISERLMGFRRRLSALAAAAAAWRLG